MHKSQKKVRITGQWRTQLDVVRFAEAIVAFALHRVAAVKAIADKQSDTPSEQVREAS